MERQTFFLTLVQSKERKEKLLIITLLLIRWKVTPERPGCRVEEMGLALPLHPPGEVYNKRKLKNRNTAAGPIIYPYHGTIVAAADVPDSLLGLSPISFMGVGVIFFL
jgi:hypothetical protein